MNMRRLAGLALPLLLLGACTSLSDSDRAMLTSANQNAEQAKNEAAQANATARQAQQAAEKAAADAQAANEKADRMFQRSLRKTAPSS